MASGEVAERFKAQTWKVCLGKLNGGSNPPLSVLKPSLNIYFEPDFYKQSGYLKSSILPNIFLNWFDSALAFPRKAILQTNIILLRLKTKTQLKFSLVFINTSFPLLPVVTFIYFSLIIEPFCKVAKLLLHNGDSLVNGSGKLR